jgi:autotransporter-associated beta strand protein
MSAAAAVGALGMFSQRAGAATDTWVGNSSTNWSDFNNWASLSVPVTGDSLVFGVSGSAGVGLNDDLMTPGTFNISDITFTSAAPGYVINPAGSNGFTLTGSIFNNSASAETINDNIALGTAATGGTSGYARMVMPGSGGMNLGGALSGTGGLALYGTGTVTLGGTDTYTGLTMVNAGTLIAGTNQISSSSPLVMAGGTLQVATQTFAGTSLNSGQAKFVNTGGTIALGAITQNIGGTADFNSGGGFITTTNSNDATGILGGWATIGNSVSSNTTGDWAANDGSGNIVAYTGYTLIASAGNQTVAAGNYSTQNWKTGALNGANDIATVGASTATPITTVNSVVVQGDFSITSGETLAIGSGGLMLKGQSRWILNNGAGNITSTTAILTSGAPSGELFIHTPNAIAGNGDNWRIWPVIANNGSTPLTLVKDGPGSVKLEHGSSSFTGNIVINGGTLYADHGLGGNPTTSMWGSLTATRQIIVNNGGILSLTGGNVFGTGGSTNTLSGLTLVVNPGGVFQTGGNTGTIGTGSWWNKMGNIVLNNGTIHIGTGANATSFQALALIGSVSVTGNAPSIIDNYAAANATADGIHLGQNGTAGQSITFNVGDVTGDSNVDLSVAPGLLNTSSNLIASGLTKVGAGTMLLTGASTFTGTTTVSNGILQLGNGTTGTLSSTAALTLGGTGTFKFQSTSGGSSQTVGATTFGAGDGTIQSTYGTSGNASLALTSLARSAGAAGNFIVSGGTNGSTNKIVITGATANALINPGVYFGGSDFAAYDSGLFVRALAYGSDTNTSAVDTIGAGTNVKLSTTPLAQSSVSLNTLNLSGSGTSLSMASGQTLTLSGGGLIKSGGGAAATISSDTGLTTGGAVELVIRTDTAADSLNIPAPIINSTAGLTKSGLGTLTLSGANTYTGTTTVDGGTLTLAASGSSSGAGDWTVRNSGTLNLAGTITTGGTLNLTAVAGGVAIANFSGTDTLANGKAWLIGNSGGVGILNITTGANLSGGNSAISAGVGGGGLGVINMSGGSVTPGQFLVAGITNAGAAGVWNVTGGTIQTTGNNGGTLGATAGTTGVLNLSGTGSYSSNNNTAAGAAGIFVGESGTGVLNVWGGGSASLGGVSTSSGLIIGKNSGASGVANLGVIGNSNATILTNVVQRTNAGATGILNFHGGTLKAQTFAASAFMPAAGSGGINSTYVWSEGGTIDNNGQSITIGQPLLGPTGNGVGTLTLSGVTKGFTAGATPVVTISGGGGSGATAISSIDANGNLTLTLTNAGTGYTSQPIVTMTGGTGTGQAFAVASLAPNTNTGAMTFAGAGTTTLSGANTYAGLTTVSAGTVRVNGSLAGAVSVSGGGAIGGTGTIAGSITLAAGATAPAQGAVNLVDGVIGTLTAAGLTAGGSAGNASLLSFDATTGNSGDTLALGAGTFTENAGGAKITITPLGGAITAGETINLLTFASGTGAGFSTGSGTTVGGLTLTNPNLSFGVTGALNVTSTAVQLITSGAVASNTAFWLGDKGTTWSSFDGAGGNFSSDKAGNNRLQSFPSTNTDVTFAATPAIASASLTNTLGQDFSIHSLTFDSDTAAANISGSNTLTIGAGGIFVKSGNGGATLAITTLAAGSSQTWENDSANNLTVGAAITLAGGNTLTINNTSTGITVLSGTNTYAGNTSITGGTVQAGSTTALSANSAYTLAAGTTLDLNSFNNAIGSLSGSGNVTLGSATLTTGALNASPTYAGAISGTGGLTKAGTGTLTLTGTNNYTGNTTINAGGTLQIGNGTTDGDIAAAANIIANGPLIFNRIGNSFSYSGVISGAATGSLTKTGPGTQSLSGANTYNGTTIINNGTLAITGGQTGTQTTSANSDIQIAPNATDVGTLSVGNATVLANRVIIGGNSGNTGTPGSGLVTQTGGTINSQQWFTVGSGSTTTTTTGTYNISAGTMNLFQQQMEVGNFGGTQGTVNLSGTGAIRLYTNTSLAMGANNNAAAGTVNQTGGTVTFFSDTGTTVGGTGILYMGKAGTLSGLFTYNLAGGTLTAPQIQRAAGTGVFNFHGGTLAAAKDNTTFMQGLSSANVYSEGATIDSNGHAVTINQALVAPGGSGLSSVALGAGGSGYAFAPTVLISGGGGVGATANAVVSGGAVTGFTITNPGTGYTGTPTFALTGGGGTGASAGTINLAANTSGGMTIQNSGASAGTVTLTGVNTYAGPTSVTGGSLVLSGSGSINNSSAITVNGSTARFAQASATPLTPNIHVIAGTLDGAGTIGNATIDDGATNTIANGNGTTTTALTSTGTISFGGNAIANLRTAYGGGLTANSARVSAATALQLQQTNASGKITLNINNSDAAWINGNYDLFGYPTGSGPTGMSSAALASLFTVGSLTGASLNGVRNQTYTLTNPTVGGTTYIALTITGDSPVWTGIVSNNWTVNAIPPDGSGNKNWRIGSTAVDFQTNDTVVFDDTATGTTNVDIGGATLDGNVSPGAVTFNNSSLTYTVNSTGGSGITGGGLVSKMGSGSVTITANNSYTGGTAVSGGTLNMTGNNTWGTGTVLVSGGTLTLSGSNTYTGSTSVSGSGTLNVNNTAALGTTSLVMSGGTLDNTSGGAITTATSVASTWNGNFAFGGTNNLSLSTSGTTPGVVTLSGGGTVTATMNAGTLTTGRIVSTNTGLTVNGAGTLAILDATNSNIGGPLTVNGNLQFASGAAANVTADFVATGLSGSGNISTGSTVERWLYVNSAASSTFSGSISGVAGLEKGGADSTTLTLSGGSSNVGRYTVAGGTLELSGTLSAGGQIYVGSNDNPIVPGIRPRLVIDPSANINARLLLVGNNATMNGAAYQTGGTVTLTNAAGANNCFFLGAVANSYGYYNMSGGTLAMNEANIGAGTTATGAVGVMDVSGTSTINDAGWIAIARGLNSSGTMNVLGGTVNYSQTASVNGRLSLNTQNFNGAGAGTAVLNIASGGSVVGPDGTSGVNGTVNLMDANGAGNFSALNLLPGGTLQANTVVAGNAGGVSHLNFNGGTLKATASNFGGNFLNSPNITAVNVYAAGGTIDNNGTNISVVNPIVAPTGNGVTSVSVTGSGYNGVPMVTFSGGGGIGASGYATINPATGALTGVTVTSAGSGYTSAPAVTLTGGGGTPASPTATIAANAASGAMTFTGSGATTIAPGAGSPTSTGLNNVVVAGGTLKINQNVQPIAAYTFNGGDTTNHGTGGSAMDGTASGSIDFTQAGHNGGNSATFGGDGALININSGITDLGPASTWTVAYWVKTDSNGTGGTIFAKNTGGGWNAGNTIFYLSDPTKAGAGSGTATGLVRNGAGTPSGDGFLKGTANLTDNTWHFVVMTDNAGTNTFYVDGALDAISQNNLNNNADAGNSVQIGNPSSTADGEFPMFGSLDDMNFYNVSLTPAQVMQLMNSGSISSVPAPSLPTTAAVNVSTSGAILDVGASATIGSLSGVAGASVTIDSGTLTTGDATTTTFAGAISGPGGLTKQGSGTFTLTGANTYSGNTNVNAGTLVIDTPGSVTSGNLSASTAGTLLIKGMVPASANVNANTGGTVKFAGNGNGAVSAAVSLATLNVASTGSVQLMLSAHATAPLVVTVGALTLTDTSSKIDLVNNELIAPGTASSARGIVGAGEIFTSKAGLATGYKDIGSGSGPIEYRATLLGDSDLDGKVNVADLANLAGNFGKTAGMFWINGDFDYNGNVNVADLADLAGNFGKDLASSGFGGGADASASPAAAMAASASVVSSGAAVPEPAALGLLGIGAVGLMTRRTRRRASN